MYSCTDPWFFTMGVSPFGNLRVNVYFQLTAAYRRLSRPSSALGAKAFILCSFSLEQLRSCSLKTSLLHCLSFANNCLGCVTNCLHCFPPELYAPLACCSFPLFIGKTFLSQKIFLNIQLSVSFLFSLFGFQ